jgi:hypothetical protein
MRVSLRFLRLLAREDANLFCFAEKKEKILTFYHDSSGIACVRYVSVYTHTNIQQKPVAQKVEAVSSARRIAWTSACAG